MTVNRNPPAKKRLFLKTNFVKNRHRLFKTIKRFTISSAIIMLLMVLFTNATVPTEVPPLWQQKAGAILAQALDTSLNKGDQPLRILFRDLGPSNSGSYLASSHTVTLYSNSSFLNEASQAKLVGAVVHEIYGHAFCEVNKCPQQTIYNSNILDYKKYFHTDEVLASYEEMAVYANLLEKATQTGDMVSAKEALLLWRQAQDRWLEFGISTKDFFNTLVADLENVTSSQITQNLETQNFELYQDYADVLAGNLGYVRMRIKSDAISGASGLTTDSNIIVCYTCNLYSEEDRRVLFIRLKEQLDEYKSISIFTKSIMHPADIDGAVYDKSFLNELYIEKMFKNFEIDSSSNYDWSDKLHEIDNFNISADNLPDVSGPPAPFDDGSFEDLGLSF